MEVSVLEVKCRCFGALWDTIFSCKAFDVFLHYGILLNGSVDLIRVLLSFQCTKTLSDLTAKLGPNVDGAACLFGLSDNAYQRHFRGQGKGKTFEVK